MNISIQILKTPNKNGPLEGLFNNLPHEYTSLLFKRINKDISETINSEYVLKMCGFNYIC